MDEPERGSPGPEAALVVDDDPVSARIVSLALAQGGMRTIVAGSRAAALAAIERAEPALAILDKNLPDGSGVDVLAALKARWPAAEAILLTAYPTFDSVVEALRHGAYDYLGKPIDVAELRHKVARALERRAFLLERERTLAELREAQRLQALAAHSEMMAQLGRMLAGIVHELRSPLAAVCENLALVIDEVSAGQPLDADSLAGLRDALTGARQLAAVVADVRRVSAVEAYARQSRRAVAVAELVDSAVCLTRGELLGKGAVVVVRVDGAPRVEGLPVRLTQVIVNLLVNAGQALTTRGARIEVRAASAGGRVRIEVEDAGCGMTPEVQARIFEPFFTTRQEAEGTGLGLALAREIMAEHGGTIAVRSTPGQGSCFALELPEAPPA